LEERSTALVADRAERTLDAVAEILDAWFTTELGPAEAAYIAGLE
jgi:hypothetical protein